MKITHKLAITLSMLFVGQVTYLMAIPSGSRSNSHGGGGDHTAARGATVHSNKNSQPSAAAVGGAVAHSNNQKADENAAATPASTTPEAVASEAPQAPLVQNSITQTPAAVPAAQVSDAKKADSTSDTTTTASTADTTKPADQVQAAEDLETIPKDQDEILEHLKAIDAEDKRAHALLSMDAMNQLFNNFVYFRDFIVKNFEKNKMLRLATEFIDQIYPKEHVATMSLKSSSSDTASPGAPADQDTGAQDSASTEAQASSYAMSDQATENQSYDDTNGFDQEAYNQYLASQSAYQSSQPSDDNYYQANYDQPEDDDQYQN